jgi:acyl-CoA thioester hydrolase
MNGNPASTQAEGRHRYTLRVYYEDTDAGGVVYHASYLRYAERARTEALRDLGIPHAALVARHGLMFVVRRIKVDYLRPARLDESLTVVTEPLAVGGASVVLRQDVRGSAGTCAVLDVQLACVAPGDEKPARLPRCWRTVLAGMHAAATAGRAATTGRDAAAGQDAGIGQDARIGRNAGTERDLTQMRAARTADKRGLTRGSGG